MSASSYLYAAARTPFGRIGGALAGVGPDDLAAVALAGALAKAPGLNPAQLDEVVWGNATGAGEESANVAGMAALLAGPPTRIAATTVHRLCGSSLEVAMTAGRYALRDVDDRAHESTGLVIAPVAAGSDRPIMT